MFVSRSAPFRRCALSSFIWVILTCCLPAPPAAAQFVDTRHTLTPTEQAELAAARDHLRRQLERVSRERGSARKGKTTGLEPLAPRVEDAAVYLDGVDRALRQSLFFSAREVGVALGLLKEGERRVERVGAGQTAWEPGSKGAGRVIVLGYRSKVDGSVQPYQVYVPAGFPISGSQGQPLEIVLHGRGGTLSEVNFLSGTGWLASSFGTTPPDHLVLYPYGRGNNGWRFAGERDAFEALADLRTRFAVDERRIILRGFSMGGHGTWHIGLQHPGTWAVMSPGAGFVDTLVYQKITEPMPDWQRSLLHLYDPVDYAHNGRNLPVLAYVGDQDPAIGQHRMMVQALRKEGVPFKEYIGPETPHRYEPNARAAILAEQRGKVRDSAAGEVHFITYTLRFPECKWVRIEGLERHWKRAEVHASLAGGQRLLVTTKNVTALRLSPTMHIGTAVEVEIDGQSLSLSPASMPVSLVRSDGHWGLGEPRTRLRKRPGMQGPIDDALFGPVLAVSGSGSAWSDRNDRWVGSELQRFREGWDHYFRATLPEATDGSVSEQALKENNLYLFGDPSSNSVIRRILPALPLQWTKQEIRIGDRVFPAEGHAPVLVFPNPKNPSRYVVLNCGFTFSRADWQGSNARQYPHLPDFAVLKIDPEHYSDDHRGAAVLAGFFDESWRVPGARRAQGNPQSIRAAFIRAFDRPRVALTPQFARPETRGGLRYERLILASEAPLEGLDLAYGTIESAYRGAGAFDRLQLLLAPKRGHTVTATQRVAIPGWLEKWLKN